MIIKTNIIIAVTLLICAIPTYAQTANIAGTVTEELSGEYVIGITVSLLSADTTGGIKVLRGAYTNKYGFYSIPEVEPGDYIIAVRSIGYKPTLKALTLERNKDIRLDLALDIADIQTDEVVVTGKKDANPTSKIGTVELEPSFIKKMPFLFENDVFRALQLLPGVQQSTELSSGLYIRGGSPDQNLVLLDNVIVYNPSHLGGFLSTFNADAIRDIKLIKGAFPAEYGGRLSSVLDMSMKEGTKDKISGEGGVSIISSRLTVEGPIGEDITFMISGRRMYMDLLLAMAVPEDEEMPTYYFYDLNAKINYKISDTDRLFLSGYFGRDVFDLEFDDSKGEPEQVIEIPWGNRTGNLRWMHIVSPTLFTNFSLIYTDYEFKTKMIDVSEDESLDIFSGINDITFKADAQYFPWKNHIIKTGIEATMHEFKSYVRTDFIENVEIELPKNNINAVDGAFFLQDEWQITPLLSSNIGGRLYYFQTGDYLNFEPRLSLSYRLTEDISVNSSFAVANQYLHLLVRNDISLPTDLWFPSTETVKPSRSTQGSVGIEADLFDNQYRFSTEVYYKDMKNIYEYKDDADFNFGVPLEEQFTSGRGEAYGMEFFLHKKVGSFTGWIGYTLSWTKRYFDELNDGKWFYPRYDRRHDISVVLTYKASDTWEISAAWVYGTGQAYTMPTGTYYLPHTGSNDYWFDDRYQYTERNGYRLPSYHRLDLNFIYNYKWFDLPFQFHMGLYNAYNRKNPFAWYIDNEYGYSGNETNKKVKQITLFPIIPNFGINFKF